MAGISKKLSARLNGPDAQLKTEVHQAVKEAKVETKQNTVVSSESPEASVPAGVPPVQPAYQGHDRR